jgi:hypothetical protein
MPASGSDSTSASRGLRVGNHVPGWELDRISKPVHS